MKFTQQPSSILYRLCLIVITLAHSRIAVAQDEPQASTPLYSTSQAHEGPTLREEILERIELGAKLGLSLATFVGKDATRELSEYTEKPSLTFGGFVNIELHRWFALQPELLFASKGPHVEFDGMVSDTFDVHYVEIPLLARFTIPVRKHVTTYVLAGPSLGILLSAKLEDHSDGSVTDRTDLANSLDLGIVGGIGAEVAISRQHAFVIEGRYDRGLTSIARADDEDLKNRVFAIVLGYQYSFSSAPASGLPDHPVPEEVPAPPAADDAAPAGQLP